jgi:hypothetical protein
MGWNMATWETRFWSKVDKSAADGCHPWTRGRSPRGYGKVGRQGAHLRAHRVAWELTFGPIPSYAEAGYKVCVLHTCDNPPCCNPAHLFLGSNADNTADRQAKGRHWARRGSAQGMAKLTEQAVVTIRAWHAQGWPYVALGAAFGVIPGTIGLVVTRKTWGHVEDREEM